MAPRRSKRVKTSHVPALSSSCEAKSGQDDTTILKKTTDTNISPFGDTSGSNNNGGTTANAAAGSVSPDDDDAIDDNVDHDGNENEKEAAGEAEEETEEMVNNNNNDENNSCCNNNNSCSSSNKEESQQEEESGEQQLSSSNKFEVLQRVYAKDQDGILYEAVIRRRMFGPHHHKQVQIGLVKSEQELDELLQESEQPMWHYFVHYNNWNVNWDRWVTEDDIYECTEQTKQYAKRITQEHKALQRTLKGKRKGKQAINGTHFLREWRKRLDQIEKDVQIQQQQEQQQKQQQEQKNIRDNNQQQQPQQELGKNNDNDNNNNDNSKNNNTNNNKTTTTTSKKYISSRTPSRWNKATVDRERKLREKDLEGKREQVYAQKIVLPFSLKKVLVEAWEIISQCHMVPVLPASVTIRHALDMYVQSKLERHSTTTTTTTTTTTDNNNNNDNNSNSNNSNDGVEKINQKNHDDNEKEKDNSLNNTNNNNDKLKKEWMDVTEGIALFFDEALPFRLIYKQEKPQYQALMLSLSNNNDNNNNNNDTATSSSNNNNPAAVVSSSSSSLEERLNDNNNSSSSSIETKPSRRRRMSDIYGCEHLLRLFLKLPEILSEELTEKETRPILGKVNDFVRFLHKHQATLFAEAYRKLNNDELREQQKIRRWEEKQRKRSAAAAAAAEEENDEDEDESDDEDDEDEEDDDEDDSEEDDDDEDDNGGGNDDDKEEDKANSRKKKRAATSIIRRH